MPAMLLSVSAPDPADQRLSANSSQTSQSRPGIGDARTSVGAMPCLKGLQLLSRVGRIFLDRMKICEWPWTRMGQQASPSPRPI